VQSLVLKGFTFYAAEIKLLLCISFKAMGAYSGSGGKLNAFDCPQYMNGSVQVHNPAFVFLEERIPGSRWTLNWTGTQSAWM
jgi:hypothetical protein